MAMALAAFASPLHAETLRIAGYNPAASDEAAALRTIAVSDFSGHDGPSLSLLIADRLRQVELLGQPWFAVLVRDLAADADAVLDGHVQPRFSEASYNETRELCVERDDGGECIRREDVELECLRITATLRPELRLVRGDGLLLWSWSPERAEALSFCPGHDDRPDFEPAIERLLGQIAQEARFQLAPHYNERNVRVLESRRDLPRALRAPFRAAIRLVPSDPVGACAAFAQLLEQAPGHPSLIFNSGLCDEQAGDLDAAAAAYRRVLDDRNADDEAAAGLERIAARRRAAVQLHGRQPG